MNIDRTHSVPHWKWTKGSQRIEAPCYVTRSSSTLHHVLFCVKNSFTEKHLLLVKSWTVKAKFLFVALAVATNLQPGVATRRDDIASSCQIGFGQFFKQLEKKIGSWPSHHFQRSSSKFTTKKWLFKHAQGWICLQKSHFANLGPKLKREQIVCVGENLDRYPRMYLHRIQDGIKLNQRNFEMSDFTTVGLQQIMTNNSGIVSLREDRGILVYVGLNLTQGNEWHHRLKTQPMQLLSFLGWKLLSSCLAIKVGWQFQESQVQLSSAVSHFQKKIKFLFMFAETFVNLAKIYVPWEIWQQAWEMEFLYFCIVPGVM